MNPHEMHVYCAAQSYSINVSRMLALIGMYKYFTPHNKLLAYEKMNNNEKEAYQYICNLKGVLS